MDIKYGVAAYNPDTGECYAAFLLPMPSEEAAELMKEGAVIARMPIQEVSDAFCEFSPSRKVVEFGASIGRYLNRDIPAWLRTSNNARYEYVGVCGPVANFEALALGQVVITPGLIYAPAV